MRLKQLELVGFKSFNKRTVLEVPLGVTGVVGPNGCGKSNIVDAMRWVLGEQSPKHLRGDNMEAVIFNGNERQAPLGMAEVSLTFENDGRDRPADEIDREFSDLPAQFRDLAEIMITRRYYRSGESEYFINKVPCRLKDITELFLGTGVGSKAYAIIEQGRVSELINAKPEDRRLFIEEAAGTTLYRSRKLAAERKMDRTRENLSRVTDILAEIDRQRRYIERQAKKAETHRRLSDELRDLELRVVARSYGKLHERLAELEQRRSEQAGLETSAVANLGAEEEARGAAEASRAETEQRLSTLRESKAVLESERQSLRERVELLVGERDERQRRRIRLQAEIEAAETNQRDMGSRLTTIEQERLEWGGHLERDESDLGQCEERLRAATESLSEIESSIEADKNALVSHVAQQAQAHNAMSSLQNRTEDIERQLGRIRDEDAALRQRISEAEERLGKARAGLEELRQRLASATEEQERGGEEVRRCAEERRRIERQIAEFEGQLVQARSRLETLEQIQARYEGFERGVRAIMGEHGASAAQEGVLGVVADVIEIPQEYERAAAAVLGERLQYVIVRGEQDGAGAVDRLRREEKGRGSFIPLHPRVAAHGAAQMNGASKRMLELVSFDESFRSVAESLLGDVVVVPNLTAAVSAWRDEDRGVTLVTPDGDVMQPSGVITGGSDRPVEEEILSRRREIEALRARAEETQTAVDSLRQAHEQASRELESAEERLRAAGEGAHDLTVEIVAAEKDIERIEHELPEHRSRREVLGYESENLREEAEVVARSLTEQRQEVERLEQQRRDIDARGAELRTRREQAAAGAEALRGELTAMKIRVAERREKQQSAVAAAESLVAQQRELRTREANLRADLESCAHEHQRLEADIEEAATREREGAERQSELEQTLQQVVAELGERSQALEEKTRAARAAREQLEALRAELQQLQLDHSEARLKSEHLAENIREKYDSEIPQWDRSVEETDETIAAEAEQVDQLRARLLKMGDVNPAAIEELRELEERSEYLSNQRDDLERSLADLEKTINKLNRASRTRFAETFAKANETFQQVFPRLFRGGEGKLVLTDENNLLETGVEIIVRPPGKRLDSVNLLSGGEKALVAVSLIFSLFLINPTPFCILDEVDAPLDDANIGRFSQMISEMSEHSQFIIVTHNKRTMESANVLYGVTMQEPGVSQLVSVALS